MSDLEKTAGLRHVALHVAALEDCVAFYTTLFGMTVEWQPDPDNYYLTSGNDNFALHRAKRPFEAGAPQHLDHLGFILNTPELVDAWHQKFVDAGVEIKQGPKTHRDGARSFYCADPDGNVVQLIFHPPIVGNQP